MFDHNQNDRLGFIAFDPERVEQMVFDAGLDHHSRGTRIMGGGNVYFSPSMQDVIICRRPIERL